MFDAVVPVTVTDILPSSAEMEVFVLVHDARKLVARIRGMTSVRREKKETYVKNKKLKIYYVSIRMR